MTEPIAEAAVLLAAVRATGGLPTSASDPAAVGAAAVAAAAAGRSLLRVPVPSPATSPRLVDGLTLGWQPQTTPSPEETHTYRVRQAGTMARLTWACCLGLAWTDRSADPHPGEPFTRAAVVDLAGQLGAPAMWVKSALDHELRPALLVVGDGDRLRLGPAAAGLPGAFVEALRRFHDRLPAAEQPGNREGAR
ncbi:hypothetical protein E9549_17530 [Blastococcus sp. MG754426]|uniref:hypothetical protein n=1 Tax=unclassified Blastococcus TaxID=2619396 RepID=UPI001EF13004|nr:MULTISPECIES: hypothetical protein [unclassified Blastococcus]MCF6509189.1 hypothetical protein [Blastococcus sp. MG754426]MCF6513720.1 hypothetical protein [Blastococcus sp. MG754427]